MVVRFGMTLGKLFGESCLWENDPRTIEGSVEYKEGMVDEVQRTAREARTLVMFWSHHLTQYMYRLVMTTKLMSKDTSLLTIFAVRISLTIRDNRA